ncbi:hypothetical protein [Burkholderia cenocepacia]|uniref:hypothetical protein n=1 Tax=Burkholderia cenocepacia TaxID=95486 RepID=UPI002ABDB761|nr:hypothetical protein [Burkholderia cenocepacia]
MHPTATLLALHGCRVWEAGNAYNAGYRVGTAVEHGWPLLAWQKEQEYWFMIAARPVSGNYTAVPFDTVPDYAWDRLRAELLREFMEIL